MDLVFVRQSYPYSKAFLETKWWMDHGNRLASYRLHRPRLPMFESAGKKARPGPEETESSMYSLPLEILGILQLQAVIKDVENRTGLANLSLQCPKTL